MRDCKDKLPTRPTPKSCHNAGDTVTRSLVVDVSVSPLHCTPEAGESRVSKSQNPDSHVGIIRLNNTHPVNFHLIILAMIERYETDSISSFGKLPANNRLLYFRPPDVPILWIIR
jgi:hypothetical protein